MSQNIVALSDVANLTPGFAFKASDFGKGFGKVVKIADLNHAINTAQLANADISGYKEEKLQKYISHQDDYLVAMTGNTIGKIGRIANGECYTNQRVLKVSSQDQNILDPEFLWCLLQLPSFANHVYSHIDSNSAQPNISAKSIGLFSFTLPHIEEQKKIAHVASSIRRKIELNQQTNDYLAA